MQREQIGPYHIVREIGRGGMATVYLANDIRIGREVALKILPPQFLHDPDFRTRFNQEARTIARLEHPAIVPLYDFGEEDGQPFMVMRYMSGGSLADRLKGGPLPIDAAAAIITRIAGALAAAHQKQIIHRDLKPENILFDHFNTPYLSDFGIAKIVAQSQTLTFGIIGTPAYMSPEQWRSKEKLDGRSDQYSLSVILYKMLSGDLPYTADETSGYMLAHMTEPVPDIGQKLPDLPPQISDFLQRGLAKNRDQRFPSITAFSDSLTALAAGQTVDISSDTAPETEFIPGHSSPRNEETGQTAPNFWQKWGMPAAVLLALILLTWGGFQLLGGRSSQAATLNEEQLSPSAELITPAEPTAEINSEGMGSDMEESVDTSADEDESLPLPLLTVQIPTVNIPEVTIPGALPAETEETPTVTATATNQPVQAVNPSPIPPSAATATPRPPATATQQQPPTAVPNSPTPVPPSNTPMPPTATPPPPTNTPQPPTHTPIPPSPTPVPPTPTPISVNPKVILQGIEQTEACNWQVYLQLSGYSPNSSILIEYEYRLEGCNGRGNQIGQDLILYNEPTDSQGNLQVVLNLDKGYGDYEMWLRDQNSNGAKIKFETKP